MADSAPRRGDLVFLEEDLYQEDSDPPIGPKGSCAIYLSTAGIGHLVHHNSGRRFSLSSGVVFERDSAFPNCWHARPRHSDGLMYGTVVTVH